MKKQDLIAKFEEVYGAGGDIQVFFAPGRVNLVAFFCFDKSNCSFVSLYSPNLSWKIKYRGRC